MGFLDNLLGNTAADASKAAAADTYAKQTAAAGDLINAGGNYRNMMTGLASYYSPWTSLGSNAANSLDELLQNPSSVASLPGYQFDLAQGTRALDHSALANGNLFSGKQGKALTGYATNLADKTYGDQLSRLLGVSQQGLGAQSAYNSTVGQGLTGELGANTSAYGQLFNAAPTIGQGEVAGANAQAQGAQNLLGTAALFGGLALGGGGGLGSLFKGANLGKLFMGGGSPSGYGA